MTFERDDENRLGGLREAVRKNEEPRKKKQTSRE